MNQENIRDRFLHTLDHIERTAGKLEPLTGMRKDQPLRFADLHKLSEGLFLASWTDWEEFLRELFIEDLATDASGALRREVKVFRTKRASWRLADSIVGHPDAAKWIEWSEYAAVKGRADSLLGAGNRFSSAAINQENLARLKRIRNAIAHKSDHAWESFKDLARQTPFSLSDMRGITVGRFLVAHEWNGHTVLRESLTILQSNARALVP